MVWSVFCLPAAGGLGLLLVYLVSRPSYYWLLREDHVVEWAQFAMIALSSIVAVAAAVRLGLRRQPLLAVVLLLVGLCACFLAGEEISWGQRVFALSTPAELASVNAQRELNVHNVQTAGFRLEDLFKVASFLMGLGGAGIAFLQRGPRPALLGRFWETVAPPLFTIPAFAGMALYRPVLLVPVTINPLVTLQEWVELSLFTGLATTVCCIYVRSARVPSAQTLRTASLSPTAWITPSIAVAGVIVTTASFAVLTSKHGIIPGNVTVVPGDELVPNTSLG
jgi:hypothetical protein